MDRPRIIPCLLLKKRGLVKTIQFDNPKYLGDPINVVKIFNDKEVDELVFLDISATRETRKPPFDYLTEIASECFMPLAYGGGIRDLEDIRKLLGLGIEKVVINSYAAENPAFIRSAADFAGSQSIVVSIDAKKVGTEKYSVFTHSGRKNLGLDPVKFAIEMEHRGAGEILLNSIDRDGLMTGYDLDLIKQVARAVSVPVVACGGCGTLFDMKNAIIEGGASAAAAGSMFVFQGPRRAVLISYPSREEFHKIFGT